MIKRRNVVLLNNRIKNRDDYKLASKFKNFSLKKDDSKYLFDQLGLKNIKLEDLTSIRRGIDENTDSIESFFENASIVAIDVEKPDNQKEIFEKYFNEGVDVVLLAGENMPCDFIQYVKCQQKGEYLKFACLHSLNESDKKLPNGDSCGQKGCNGLEIKENDEDLHPLLELAREVIRRVKPTNNLIPIFKYSFMLDKLIWNYYYGDNLFVNRFNHNFDHNPQLEKIIIDRVKEREKLAFSLLSS